MKDYVEIGGKKYATFSMARKLLTKAEKEIIAKELRNLQGGDNMKKRTLVVMVDEELAREYKAWLAIKGLTMKEHIITTIKEAVYMMERAKQFFEKIKSELPDHLKGIMERDVWDKMLNSDTCWQEVREYIPVQIMPEAINHYDTPEIFDEYFAEVNGKLAEIKKDEVHRHDVVLHIYTNKNRAFLKKQYEIWVK